MAQGHDAQKSGPLSAQARRMHAGNQAGRRRETMQDAHKGRPYYGRALVLFAHVSRKNDANLPGGDGLVGAGTSATSSDQASGPDARACPRNTSPRTQPPSIVGTLLVRVQPADPRASSPLCLSASSPPTRVRPARYACPRPARRPACVQPALLVRVQPADPRASSPLCLSASSPPTRVRPPACCAGKLSASPGYARISSSIERLTNRSQLWRRVADMDSSKAATSTRTP